MTAPFRSVIASLGLLLLRRPGPAEPHPGQVLPAGCPPRFLSTLDRISAELASDSLVYRYASTGHDGIGGGEGTFNLCSFWYVEALTHAGRVKEARMIFEKMPTYANHVGLYAEQIGASGEALGNFPQAFTHLALISAAINLDRALDRQ